MNKAESMGLTKVVITEDNRGFPVGSVVYWDKDKITDARWNDGDVVWNTDMTRQRWQNIKDMEVLMDSEGTGNG